MDRRIAQNAMSLLNRVQLQGAEAGVFLEIMTELQKHVLPPAAPMDVAEDDLDAAAD